MNNKLLTLNLLFLVVIAALLGQWRFEVYQEKKAAEQRAENYKLQKAIECHRKLKAQEEREKSKKPISFFDGNFSFEKIVSCPELPEGVTYE